MKSCRGHKWSRKRIFGSLGSALVPLAVIDSLLESRCRRPRTVRTFTVHHFRRLLSDVARQQPRASALCSSSDYSRRASTWRIVINAISRRESRAPLASPAFKFNEPYYRNVAVIADYRDEPSCETRWIIHVDVRSPSSTRRQFVNSVCVGACQMRSRRCRICSFSFAFFSSSFGKLRSLFVGTSVWQV